MRVTHLYDGHERVRGRGSVPAVVWNAARRVAARGHEVTVVERQWAGTDRVAEHEGVTFRRLALSTGSDEPWSDIPYEMVSSASGAIRLVLDRANFARAARTHLGGQDVVHVHLPFAATLLATFRPGLARRMVYTAHLGETERRVRDPIISPDAWLARRAARTIALNPAMADAFRHRGVPDNRLHVIPNGVDLERFSDVDPGEVEAVRETYDLAGPVILFVGTVTPRKGVADLVAAAERVLTDRDGHLLLAGRLDLDPEYVAEVRSAVPRALADRVTFAGFVSDAELVALYQAADIFALPSREEGSSVAVTEALAAGLPVVATDIPGIAQQVQHDEHGLLAPPGDVKGLADHLAALLDDGPRRERLSRAARERAEARSWDRTVDRLLAVYREVTE